MAALIVAIEPELISWGVQGWRDDAFTVFFLSFGSTCLMFRARPSRGHAALLAITTSLTLLTRLTALSFVAPAFLLLAWEASGNRGLRGTVLRRLAGAAVVIAVLVSPYFINCWTRFGDPLIAINRNTDFYRARAKQQVTERMPADAYLASLVRERPVATADIVLQGLTTYPFFNKFLGLRPWSRWLRVLPVLAAIGLLAWPWSPQGRWLLLLLGALRSFRTRSPGRSEAARNGASRCTRIPSISSRLPAARWLVLASPWVRSGVTCALSHGSSFELRSAS